MKSSAVTERLLAAKKLKGLTFADLEKTVGRDEVWIAARFHRQVNSSEEEAKKIAAVLDFGADATEALTAYPT